jgi:hypothetical protein
MSFVGWRFLDGIGWRQVCRADNACDCWNALIDATPGDETRTMLLPAGTDPEETGEGRRLAEELLDDLADELAAEERLLDLETGDDTNE